MARFRAGATGFDAQGGQTGGCGVPASATAGTFTLIANGPDARGSIKVSSADTTPDQFALTYQGGQQTTGAVASRLSGAGLKVINAGGPTNLTIGVTGYSASISTWYDSTRPDTVRVNVWDANGNPADQYVYIHVDC
jgi:hypothetical protein